MACIFWASGLYSEAMGQTTNWLIPHSSVTNAIPANLYLTDDGELFGHNPARQRVVHLKTLIDAEQSPESRPAEQDTEGHWGQPTNGFQLSMRFEKSVFTNCEPIVANLLLRNVTNTPVKFWRLAVAHQPSPINIVAFSGQKPLPRKGDDGEIDVISAAEITIYPQAQRKYTVNLNSFYDLTGGGVFIFQAKCGKEGEITSQSVQIQVQ